MDSGEIRRIIRDFVERLHDPVRSICKKSAGRQGPEFLEPEEFSKLRDAVMELKCLWDEEMYGPVGSLTVDSRKDPVKQLRNTGS